MDMNPVGLAPGGATDGQAPAGAPIGPQPQQQLQQPQQPASYSAFYPWDVPVFTAPPTDAATRDRMQLLIKHCLANGPGLLNTVKQKQQGDPNFAFLVPGQEGHAYFKWALYCGTMGTSADQPQQVILQPPPGAGPPAPATPSGYAPAPGMHVPVQGAHIPHQQPGMAQQQAMAPQQPPTGSMQLSPEVEAGFGQVLDALTGSKESIKASQQWFMACGPAAAPGLARLMAVRSVAATTSFEKQLHIIYLANDILFKGLAARAAGAGPAQDHVSSAMQPVIGAMLAAAYISGGRTDETRAKLSKILDFWGERQVFDTATIANLHTAMTGAENPASALAIALAQAAAAAAAAKAAAAAAVAAAPPPQAAPPGGYPGHMGYPGAGMQQQPWGVQGPPQAAGMVPPGQYSGHVGQMPGVGGWGAPQYGMQPMPGQMPGHPMMQPQQPHMMQAHMMGMQQQQQHSEDGWGVPPQDGNIMVPQYHNPHAQQQGWGQQGFAPPSGLYPPPPDLIGATPGSPPRERKRRRWDSSRSRSRSRSRDRSSSRSRSRDRSRSRSHSPSPRPKKDRMSRFHTGPVAPAFPPRDIAVSPKREEHAVPEPAPEPVSSFNFPPGLLPALCAKRKASGATAYEPLLPEEIEAEGLPPPPTKDDYLASRLERFFAEMRDYRPGITRADVEDPGHSWHRQRLRQEYEQDPEGLRQRWWRGGGRRHAGGRGDGGRIYADGTFSGSGSMYAGLGTHIIESVKNKAEPEAAGGLGLGLGAAESPAAGLGAVPISLAAAPPEQAAQPDKKSSGDDFDDMYNSYRSMRSDGYHAMIMANAAKAQMNSVVPRRLPRPA